MGEFEGFLEALGKRESGTDVQYDQYRCVNFKGLTGKYQFGEALLKDLGYYEADRFYNGGENGVDRCYWRGTWTRKANNLGVYNYEDFRNNKGNIQEVAIREALRFNTKVILREVGGKNRLNQLLQESGYTYPGILAAAHLQGAWGAAGFLKNKTLRWDENGTCISKYAQEFSKFNFGLLVD